VARRRARELAFQALFQAERSGEAVLDVWRDIRSDFTEQEGEEAVEVYGSIPNADGLVFAERLVTTFAEHQSDLDHKLSEVLEGWTFSQMSQTDLAVLRLALTELTYEDLPPEVTFEVAVRIAKRYGGEESGRFVNGVLARLHREKQAAPEAGTEEEAAQKTVENP
jgi:N utilization substance protein B